jgi:DNA-binding response OmpR family regulator
MAGGHTTMIQRVLERRAEKPPSSDEGTSATIAVMVRVLPPPKALLVFEDAMLCAHTERRIGPELLDFESTSDELGALRRLKAEYRPIVLTDNPEFLRKLRGSLGVRVAFALFVSGVDDPLEREAALLAGADDCIERRAVDEEFNARLRGARRIAELEAVARTTLTENRKLSAIAACARRWQTRPSRQTRRACGSLQASGCARSSASRTHSRASRSGW